MSATLEHAVEHETLLGALIAAQADFPPIFKDATNPHFRSKYADLPGIVEAVSPVLRRHGLACVQRGVHRDGVQLLVTELVHKSGSVASEMALPVQTGADPQKLGSALTYVRRYSLLALLGLAPDEDDDGNGAVASPPAKAKRATKAGEDTVPGFWLDGETLAPDEFVARAKATALELKPAFVAGWWEEHRAERARFHRQLAGRRPDLCENLSRLSDWIERKAGKAPPAPARAGNLA